MKSSQAAGISGACTSIVVTVLSLPLPLWIRGVIPITAFWAIFSALWSINLSLKERAE